MRHITATPCPRRDARRVRDGTRVAAMGRGRHSALKALRLALPLILLFLAALGQVASAHSMGGQHAQHVSEAPSHHADAADSACCGDPSQDDGKSCLAQCLASCSYCAPLPLAADFPDAPANRPRPAASEPMRGALAPPHLRPPSIS